MCCSLTPLAVLCHLIEFIYSFICAGPHAVGPRRGGTQQSISSFFAPKDRAPAAAPVPGPASDGSVKGERPGCLENLNKFIHLPTFGQLAQGGNVFRVP